MKLHNYISAHEILQVIEDESFDDGCAFVELSDKTIFRIAGGLTKPSPKFVDSKKEVDQYKYKQMIISGLNKKYAHITPNICRKVQDLTDQIDEFNDAVEMVINTVQGRTS